MFAPVYAGPTTEKSPGGPDEPGPGAKVTPASGEPASGDMTPLGATPHSWPDTAPNTALADGEAFLDDGERSTRSAASDELRYSSPLRPRSLYETLPTGRRTPPSSRRDAPHARPLPPPPPRPPPPATAQPPSWVITCCYK
mmetsp:Transcript_19890/g.58985  ORF Transcript_19890/g.58985 Transcript_19890/m.58985 type:complete len:141 (-) Transcript_19890:61-483(-)